ncbi:Outer envelope pore protein 16-4 protein [Thalictrum thalictroides]|uniref:Outer envelope pore protein 16-4 protein n=1 Tax=Thalictrum thalictroides TaxID=46969 RepID=A0A7J6WKJ1_THATH|nr:Outer envelope pore protein 16-4 protein [Thalictrum thalictroides]
MQFVKPDVEEIPCESIAADNTVRIAAAGIIWGLTASPYDAGKLGLTGIPRVSYVLKSAGSLGWQCGLFAGIYSTTRCQLQNYREKKDWLNAAVAGALTGAIFAAKSGCSGMKVLGMTALISSITTATEFSTTKRPSE